jgi:hypothetical protein
MYLLKLFTAIKNPFVVGFLISLIGSLPLGYANVIDLEILLTQGNLASFSFIAGIVFIHFFVLKATALLANWLVSQKKLVAFISWFTLVLFLLLGFVFFLNRFNSENFSSTNLPLLTYPFFLGVFINILNFIQWPYWSGIYILLSLLTD